MDSEHRTFAYKSCPLAGHCQRFCPYDWNYAGQGGTRAGHELRRLLVGWSGHLLTCHIDIVFFWHWLWVGWLIGSLHRHYEPHEGNEILCTTIIDQYDVRTTTYYWMVDT